MIKVAINGFGRIGRPTFKRLIENHSKEIEVVAINDLTDTKTLAHLLKYDSVHGIYDKEIGYTEKEIKVEEKSYTVLAEKEPGKLPWKKLEVDVVLECTGFFTNYEGAKPHLTAGAKKVIISAPCKSEEIPTYVLGGNEEKYNPGEDNIISMGSCTTNCLVPMVKILNDNLTIERALMTTIHSYTSTQRIVDGPHKDLRRGRAAAVNIIPTTTGAAISTVRVLPELENKLDGIAIRVPTVAGSLSDVTAQVKKETSVEEVNNLFKESAENKLKGIVAFEKKPLVSTDFIGNPHSVIIDSQFTNVQDGHLVKILGWYDNEWGYACRLAEMAEFMGKKL